MSIYLSNDYLIKFLNAVKQDDLNVFNEFIKEDERLLNICFGRIPLLSMIYLYNAKKIEKKYQEKLIHIEKYNIVEEDYDAYKKFLSYAKRSLRMYQNEDIVTPLEMLTICEEYIKLERSYSSFNKTDKIKKNIENICLNYQNKFVKVSNNQIIAPRKDFSLSTKILLNSLIAISLILIIISSIAYAIIPNMIGNGTKESPYLISTEKQFIKQLSENSSGLYYKLTKDIELNNVSIDSFSGYLDGNGKKLKISNFGIIKENKGEITNLILDISGEYNLTQEGAFFVNQNKGKIDNVRFIGDAIIKEDSSKDIYSSGLVFLNSNENGVISNIIIDSKIRVSGNGEGEISFSYLSVYNEGNISEVDVLDSSEIVAQNADISAVAYTNSNTITNVENNALISQTVTTNTWNPFSAGVAINNLGKIANAVNNGTVQSISEMDNANIAVFSSGIVSRNYGTITESINNGLIQAKSMSKNTAYVGGIVCVNAYYSNYNLNGVITNSKTYGELILQSKESMSTVGGIAAYNYCYINECLSKSMFNIDESDGELHLGGIAGITDYYSGFFSNNYSNIKMSGSESSLNVIISENSKCYIGGMIGSMCGYLIDSYSYSDINVKSQENVYVGQIAGVVQYEQFMFNNVYYVKGYLDNVGAIKNKVDSEWMYDRDNIYSIEGFVEVASYNGLKKLEVYIDG